MKIVKHSKLNDVWVAEYEIFHDSRGSFRELYNCKAVGKVVARPMQINMSVSNRGCFRGIHFQKGKYNSQDKYVNCIRGSITDFVIDLRPYSTTYLEYDFFELNELEGKAIYIPEGFGHGFLAHDDNTTVMYACNNLYSPADGVCLNVFDESLGLPNEFLAKINPKMMSKNDYYAPLLKDIIDALDCWATGPIS